MKSLFNGNMVAQIVFLLSSFVINLSSSPMLGLQEYLSFYVGTRKPVRQATYDSILFYPNLEIISPSPLATTQSPTYKESTHNSSQAKLPLSAQSKDSDLPTSSQYTIWKPTRYELNIIDYLRAAMKDGRPTQGLKEIPRLRVDEETQGKTCSRPTPSFEMANMTAWNYPKLIHIPKNAGATIEHFGNQISLTNCKVTWGQTDKNDLKKAGVEIHKIDEKELPKVENPKIWYQSCSWWHRPVDWWRAWGFPYFDNRRTFCVVRNPFSRVNSEVNFLKHSKPPNCLTTSQVENTIKKQLGNRKHLALSLGGREYNKPIGDCHWVPQVNYVFDDNGCRVCDDVLFFEDLVHQLTVLFTAYGFEPPFEFKKLNYQKCKESKVNLMEEETVQMIVGVYEKDFLTFGYSLRPGTI
jgi:hypothetical protein